MKTPINNENESLSSMVMNYDENSMYTFLALSNFLIKKKLYEEEKKYPAKKKDQKQNRQVHGVGGGFDLR